MDFMGLLPTTLVLLIFGAKKHNRVNIVKNINQCGKIWTNLHSAGHFLTSYAVPSKLQSLHCNQCKKQASRSAEWFLWFSWSDNAANTNKRSKTMQWNLILKFNDKNYEQHEMEFWLKNDEKYWSNQSKELATMISQLFPRSSLLSLIFLSLLVVKESSIGTRKVNHHKKCYLI